MALTVKKVYAILKRQISDMEAKIKTPIIYRGTVATADLLPLNPDIGDMYNIESKSIYGEAGMNVAWNGVVWDTMGAPIDMSLYIKSSELSDWVKQQNKPTYTAEEVGALPDTTVIPSKTSELQNDSGFLTKIPDNYLSGTDKTLNVSGKAADAKATGDKITELSADISKKLNKNQGSENSGKIAGINESGDIVPMFPVSVDYNEETNCLEFGSDQKMELNKGINLDNTLTKTGYAADAGAVGKITDSLKEDLVDLESETKNIFNPRWLLNATGWTRNGNSYTGTAGNLNKAYKENNYPISFEPNTKYTLSLKALTNGSASTGGYGIQFEFYYTDGTKDTLSLLNNTLHETSYVFGTNSQKSISYMRIRHSSGGNNTWVLSEIQIEKGNKTDYVNSFTANDIIARKKIEVLESKTNTLKENTEIEMSEVKSNIDDLAVQSGNLIIAVGIDNIKNKGFYVTTDDGYNAFPFIGTVNNKLVCVYSIGKNHTDNTNVDIFVKTSPNGVIWSKAKKIISTENVRDTITGLGHDSLGIIYFWNRKGTPVNADCSFDLYKTSDGIVFTKKSSPIFDIKPSHIGDVLHIPTVGVISFYNTYRANRNSYGYVITKDGGETWSQVEIANPSTQSDTPTEICGVYIGDGKIIALGRSEDNAPMFQIQSNDYGKTWETKITNITDVYLSTPTLIYDDDGYITVYYYNRGDGKLKKRRAIASAVFENPLSWGEPSNIASGAVGQDAGNANSVKFKGNNIIVYYSGTDTETSVIDVIN